MDTVITEPPTGPNGDVRKCPSCGGDMRRTARTPFMRVLKGSKRYHCGFCYRNYLYFLWLFWRS